ncbi:MAG: SIS domain-containing protein [Enterobacterales bacterium]|nr:SIS domain-containing protein [Enterobacterales bacterium]
MKKTRSPLENLYPFLHGKQKSKQSDLDSLLISIQQKADDSARVSQQFFRDNAQAIIAASQAIANVYLKGGRMLTMGNGGSSCDASHFAVEFQHPVTTGRPALPAFNMVMDTAMLSAVANDVGIKHIYVRQLDAQAGTLDGLIGFSTSGNSENLLAAFEKAKKLNLVTLGLTGGNGGEMMSSGLVDHCLVVDTDSIHRVQEVHVATYHILWDLVHTLLADGRGALNKNLKEIDD